MASPIGSDEDLDIIDILKPQVPPRQRSSYQLITQEQRIINIEGKIASISSRLEHICSKIEEILQLLKIIQFITKDKSGVVPQVTHFP